jgi:hypothetical protein
MKRLASTIALACLLSSPLAHAGEDAGKSEAKARFQEGLALYDAGKYDDARLKFAQAYAAYPSSDILYNLARAEQVSGHYAEAAGHFRMLLADPKNKDDSKRRLGELDQYVGHIAVDVPQNARVTVDGADVPVGTLDVMPGPHVVITTIGDKTYRTDAAVISVGQTFTVTGPRTDGHAGDGAVRTTGASGMDAGNDAEPVRAAPPAQKDEPRRIITPRNVTVAGLGVASVALLTVAVVETIVTTSNASKVKDASGSRYDCYGSTSQTCRDLHDAAANSDTTIAIAPYVGGAVLGIAAVTAFIFWPKDDAKKAVWVAPSGGRSGAGIQLGGSF